MDYGEPGPSAVLSSQSPTFYRERTGSVPAGQANYESSSSSGVGNNSRTRDRDTPPPIGRSSTESSSQHPSRNFLPNVQLIRRDSISDTREGTLEELVPTSFDESAIRVLCDMDVRLIIDLPRRTGSIPRRMVFNACSIVSNRAWRPVEYVWYYTIPY